MGEICIDREASQLRQREEVVLVRRRVQLLPEGRRNQFGVTLRVYGERERLGTLHFLRYLVRVLIKVRELVQQC